MRRIILPFVLAPLALWIPALAEPASPASSPATMSAKAAATSQPASAGVAIAVLDFEASSPSNPEMGKQIAELLSASLSGFGDFTIVDRTWLTRTLQEQEMSLTGMVSTEQAVKVGKLVGAKILVTGKAFPMGQQMFVTARLIGTETSLMKGVLVKAPLNGDMSDLVGLLSEKVAQQLMEAGPQLVAAREAASDPLPGLRKRLADRAKPTVAVLITERHIAQHPERRIDPAVQTQVKHLLVECGFQVIDVPTEALESAGHIQDIRDPAAWAKLLPGVKVLVLGEAFSEYATRIGNLISCTARTEIKVIRLKDGQTLLVDRCTHRAVDLAENTAAKNALQSTGQVLGEEILEYFARNLPTAARAGQ
jgi:TolB-like protein